MGITGIHAIPMMITCMLQGTLCDTGIPCTFYGGNICSVNKSGILVRLRYSLSILGQLVEICMGIALQASPKAGFVHLILFCPTKHQSQSTWTLWMALHTIFRGNLKRNTGSRPMITTAWLWISTVAKWPWKSGTLKYFSYTITVYWGHLNKK